MGRNKRFSHIWSKKQVESAWTVVQGYVGGLLRLSGEPGWFLYRNHLENDFV